MKPYQLVLIATGVMLLSTTFFFWAENFARASANVVATIMMGALGWAMYLSARHNAQRRLDDSETQESLSRNHALK